MRVRSIFIALIIVALPVGFMYHTLVQGRPLARDDASAMVYPIFHAMDAQLAEGSLYLWDARQWCGLPALAGGETTGLYPPTLALCALLPWMTALHASYWLHLALGAAGVYWVARNLGATRKGAVLGGAAFAFSGYQAAHLIHHGHITALAHMPLMLAVLQTALAKSHPRWWALLAAEVALAGLSSHPMLLVMALTVSLLWVIFGHDWLNDEEPAHARLVPLLLALVVAGLLAAPQLLPSLDLAAAQGKVAASADVEQTASRIASYPFRARDLVRVLLPTCYGTVHENILGGGPQWHETTPFTGAAPLLLGIAGAIVAFRRRGWGFCIVIFVVGAALMPGPGNPLHALLARVPVVSGFRAMGRWMVLPILSLSLLSALAVTFLPDAARRLRHGASNIAGIIGGLIMAVTTVLWLVFGVDGEGRLWLPGQGGDFPLEVPADAMLNCMTSWEPVLLVAAALVTWLVLARMAGGRSLGVAGAALMLLAITGPQWYLWQRTNLTVPRAYYADPPATARAVRASGRITTLAPQIATPGWSAPGSTWQERRMNDRELLTRALGTVWDVSYAGGYLQGLVTPSTLRLWESSHFYGAQAFLGEPEPDARIARRYGTPVERMKRLHRLAGVRHIVTTGELEDTELEVTHRGIANVHTYTTPRPRWWLARKAITIMNPRQQLDAVERRDFNPDTEVVVDADMPLTDDPDLATGDLSLVEETPTTLTLRTSCPAARVLVLTDAWYPGWRVTVDGEAARLLRANYAFRAVAVPEGQHTVTFSFWPRTWGTALPLFVVGLLVVVALALWPEREPPREGLTPPGAS